MKALVSAFLAVLFPLVACSTSSESGSDATVDGMADADSVPRSDVDVVTQDAGGDTESDAWMPPSEPSPASLDFSWAELKQPSVESRPWVRWWWPGNAVTDEQIALEINDLAARGFGGAEIQAFDAALDPAASAEELAARGSVNTDSWREHVASAMAVAKEAGLKIDLTAGSGWPSGGSHVGKDQSMQTLLWATRTLEGPKKTTIAFGQPAPDPFYEVSEMAAGLGEPLARWLPEEFRLIAAVAAPLTEGMHDPNPFVVNDSITIDLSRYVVLTDRIDNKNQITWDVPPGQWQLVVFYQGPDGGFVSLTAEDGESFVADHFDGSVMEANLDHLLWQGTFFEEHAGGTWRAVFNDSFEFKTERHWSDDFLAEFESRMGYDLEPYLPLVVVPGADNHIFDGGGIKVAAPFSYSEDDERIRRDYQQVVSDLFIERFVDTTARWAADRGLLSRVQPYGIRVDVLRAAGHTHLPEAEQLYAGGSDWFVSMVASGGHIYNRRFISAEALVWAGRDYMTTPVKLRAAVDKLFAAGVNWVIFHGFPYQTEGPYGETGWHPFCSPFSGLGTYSSNISAADPIWDSMPELNLYISRVQHLMRLGRPASDLLIFWPFMGFPASLARVEDLAEPLFLGALADFEGKAGANPLYAIADSVFGKMDPGESGTWLLSAIPVLNTIRDQGYSIEWLNDESLCRVVLDGQQLELGGNRYAAMVFVDVPWLSQKAAEAVERLTDSGANIVVVGQPPQKVPGFHNRAAGDAVVTQAFGRPGILRIGEANGLIGNLTQKGVMPRFGISWDSNSAENNFSPRTAARVLEGGASLLFISNPSVSAGTVTVRPHAGCDSPTWYDAWSHRWAKVEQAGESYQIPLPKLSSVFLLCGFSEAGEESPSPTFVQSGEESMALGPFAFELAAGAGQPAVSIADFWPVDWRDVEQLRHRTGEATYSLEFNWSGSLEQGRQAVLSLDWVFGSAEVVLNGKVVGQMLVSPFELDVTGSLKSGSNTLQIRYSAPLRNHLLFLGDSGDAQHVQFKNKPGTSIPTGITGAVTLHW